MAANNIVAGEVELVVGLYRKRLSFPAGQAEADEWKKAYDGVEHEARDIVSLEVTQRFTHKQQILWRRWLGHECQHMLGRWGAAMVPATMRYWMIVVTKEVGYGDVIFAEEDLGGNGKFDPDYEWKQALYPPKNLQQDGPSEFISETGCWLVPFTFEESYQKKIEFAIDGIDNRAFVTHLCYDWYADMMSLAAHFEFICGMDGSRNDTDAQVEKWAVWLDSAVQPFIERWGKNNVPLTMRVRINAVERKLRTHAVWLDGQPFIQRRGEHSVPLADLIEQKLRVNGSARVRARFVVTHFGEDTYASGFLPAEYTLTDF